jgi:hypothetical protein
VSSMIKGVEIPDLSEAYPLCTALRCLALNILKSSAKPIVIQIKKLQTPSLYLNSKTDVRDLGMTVRDAHSQAPTTTPRCASSHQSSRVTQSIFI